jgi:CopG family nickel-responsive transcriptional regulator
VLQLNEVNQVTKESQLKRFGISIHEDLLDRFDILVRSRGYVGRSEAIRDAMRLFITQWELETKQEGSAATLSVVYRHKAKLMAELTNAQHESNANVISTMHVHLTHSHCLEVLTLSGKGERIRELADRISGLTGVEFAKLFMFSIPESSDHDHSH